MYYSSGNDPVMYNSYSDANSCTGPVLAGWPVSPPCHASNGQLVAPPGEQPYYGRPSYHQPESESSSRLAFLYDRAYNTSQQQPLESSHHNSAFTAVKCPSRLPGDTMQNGYSTGPYHLQQDDLPPPLPTSPPPSNEYQPISRAMPAPMYQHGGKTTETQGSEPISAIRQVAAPAMTVQQNGSQSPTAQKSPTNVSQQLSRLGLSDRHPPPAPGQMSSIRSRDVNGSAARMRAMPTSFSRRQSAPGPCLPPANRESTPTSGKKQWALTPCGFTNTRGQPGSLNGRRTPSTPCDTYDGLRTPQSAVPRSADVAGPKLFTGETYRRNPSFGSQESFLDSENSTRNNADIDTSSIRYNLREGDEVGDYEQTSIRYTGKTNPSKMFQLLQTATGSDTETDVKLAQAAMRRQVRRRRPTQEELEEQSDLQRNADDIVDISYIGSSIPSRTFRCLQEAIGARERQPQAAAASETPNVEQPGRSVKVIHLRPSMKKHSSLDNILSYTDL